MLSPSTPGPSKWPLSLWFPHQNPVYTSPLLMLLAPAHLIFLHLVIRKILREQSGSSCSLLCSVSPFPYHIIPIRPKYSLQHPILKSPKLTFLPQCERPSFTPIHHKRRFIVFILIFKFLNSKLEDK